MLRKADIIETRQRILVIDDDNYIAEFFGAFFDEKEFDVRVASDIEAGRNEIKGADYDVLFLDVQLPGADGLDMLADVKAAVDMGKVVMITGEVTKELKRRVASLGVGRCLGKPFDLEEIRRIVDCSRPTELGPLKTSRKSDTSNENVTIAPTEEDKKNLFCKEFKNSTTNGQHQNGNQQRKADGGQTK